MTAQNLVSLKERIGAAIWVYEWMRCHVDGSGSIEDASIKRLAADLDIRPRSVQRHVRNLESNGILKREPRLGRMSVYRLLVL